MSNLRFRILQGLSQRNRNYKRNANTESTDQLIQCWHFSYNFGCVGTDPVKCETANLTCFFKQVKRLEVGKLNFYVKEGKNKFYTTKLTSLSGTTINFLTAFPSSRFWIFSEASTFSSVCFFSIPTGH